MIEHKVLPFKLQDNTEVPGHAILVCPSVKSVVFSHFDQDAQMPVEVVVPVSRFTQYLHKAPIGRTHTINAVICTDGGKISCTTYSVAFSGDNDWADAPVLAQRAYRIARLGDRTTLVEIAGVKAWSYNRNDPSLIIDPWKRDNEEYAARMKAKAN